MNYLLIKKIKTTSLIKVFFKHSVATYIDKKFLIIMDAKHS